MIRLFRRETGRQKSRGMKFALERHWIKDQTAEHYSSARWFGQATQRGEIRRTGSAMFFLCRSDNHQFPISKKSARVLCESLDQQMHAFFWMNTADEKDDFFALPNRRRRVCTARLGLYRDEKEQSGKIAPGR